MAFGGGFADMAIYTLAGFDDVSSRPTRQRQLTPHTAAATLASVPHSRRPTSSIPPRPPPCSMATPGATASPRSPAWATTLAPTLKPPGSDPYWRPWQRGRGASDAMAVRGNVALALGDRPTPHSTAGGDVREIRQVADASGSRPPCTCRLRRPACARNNLGLG